MELDEARNRSNATAARPIHRQGARLAVWVVPTNEELEIAEQTLRCVQSA